MRGKLVLTAGAAALGLVASPALAGGLLGSSGNMGGLLGGPPGGGHAGPPGGLQPPGWGAGKGHGGWKGGEKGGEKGGHGGDKGGHGGHGPQSGAAYSHKEQTTASHQSGSQFKKSSFTLNDTNLGGVYANPQVSGSHLTASHEKGGEFKGGGGYGGHKGGHEGGHGGHKGGPSGSHHESGQISKKSFAASFPIAVEGPTIGGFSSHKASGSSYENNSYSNKEATRFKTWRSGGGHGDY